MTAEACVMNKLAVALAADSAVTVASSPGPKIFQSADKLFQLSEADPVAAMVYGSASFLGVPWETIIKRYRSLQGGHSYATVEDHGKAFLRFLETDRTLFPESRQQRSFADDLRSLFRDLLDKIREHLKTAFGDGQERSANDVKRLVDGAISNYAKQLSKSPLVAKLPRTFPGTVRRKYASTITVAIKEVFERLPLTESARRNLRKIAGDISIRGQWEDTTGLVIAGFGRQQVFPSFFHTNVERLLANRLRHREADVQSISDKKMSIVKPFAQSEMVHTYMEGIEPGVLQFFLTALRDVFSGLPEAVASSAPGMSDTDRTVWRGELQSLLQEQFGRLDTSWGAYRNQHHVQPITSTVAMLPKDELASMAESLVNLTVLRRRTSTEAETVGGPIDVAVITKGDGFVWIKRKHYFSSELNPRYMARLTERKKEWQASGTPASGRRKKS